MPQDQATNLPAAEDDFEGAFAQANSKPPAADAVNGGDQSDAQGADSALAAGGSEQAAAPAPAPAAKQASAPSAAPAKQPNANTDTVESLRQQLTDALQRERSVAGRISASDQRCNQLQRENNDLKRQLQAAQSAAKAAPAVPAIKPGQNIDDVLSQTPELQAAVMARIDASNADLRQALDAANAKLTELGEATTETANAVKPVVQQQAVNAVQKVQSELDTAFTEAWREDIRTPEFKQWLDNRSQRIRDTYFNSTSTEETTEVLDLFYASRGGRPKPAAANTTAANSAGNPNTGPVAQDRLREAAGIAPRPGARVSAQADDFDGAFAEANQKRLANARK